mmetsp:Transcript_25345/g.48062  ORF Transcript_25345/g.48062 Transcript_25345/m.48062 type:complete len:200 (-) Transcript_25345:1150-1749(-)
MIGGVGRGIGSHHLKRRLLVLYLVADISIVQLEIVFYMFTIMSLSLIFYIDVVEHHLPRANLPRHRLPVRQLRGKELGHDAVGHGARPALHRHKVLAHLQVPRVHRHRVHVVAGELAVALRGAVRGDGPEVQRDLQRLGVHAGEGVVQLHHQVVPRVRLAHVEVVVRVRVGLARAHDGMARDEMGHRVLHSSFNGAVVL